MQHIRWGIIGCGDVCEVKSGPGFYKAPHSSLVAVMRRNEHLAADFARRHGVPRWYSHPDQLIADPDVDAVYIATPPAAHESAALAAIAAGKPVYVEKPMAHTYASARRIADAAEQGNIPLCVAHYRRMQPLFLQLKTLLNRAHLGKVRNVQLHFVAPASAYNLSDPGIEWRLNPDTSGGGIFHDLAPHQLDILFYLFGNPIRVQGMAANNSRFYAPPDVIGATLLLPNDVLAHCSWLFVAAHDQQEDWCQVNGEKGWLRFPIFGKPYLEMMVDGIHSKIAFDPLPHVQQPMIEAVNQYFRRQGPNPCDGAAGLVVMQSMEAITG